MPVNNSDKLPGSKVIASFQLFAKIFQRKFLTRGVRCARAASSRNYFNEKRVQVVSSLDGL